MEFHVEDLRRSIQNKENILNALTETQTKQWKFWDEQEQKLSEIQISRETRGLNELKSQLNQTLVAYNDSLLAQKALPFGKRLFSVERTEELQKKLQVPLTHEDVSTRQAGGRTEVVYIETFKALEKAQEVFGFDLSLEIKSEPSLLFQQNGKVVMKAIVRVTLANGCYHEDVGIGISSMGDTVESVRMAAKACVSDSIKRALQHFGPALGSCLRDKEWVNTDLNPAVQASKSGKTPRKFEEPMNHTDKRPRAMQQNQQPINNGNNNYTQQHQQPNRSSSSSAVLSNGQTGFNAPPPAPSNVAMTNNNAVKLPPQFVQPTTNHNTAGNQNNQLNVNQPSAMSNQPNNAYIVAPGVVPTNNQQKQPGAPPLNAGATIVQQQQIQQPVMAPMANQQQMSNAPQVPQPVTAPMVNQQQVNSVAQYVQYPNLPSSSEEEEMARAYDEAMRVFNVTSAGQ